MRFVLVALMLVGSLVVASFVLSSSALDVVGLVRGAGWYALIALAWPLTIGFFAWRN